MTSSTKLAPTALTRRTFLGGTAGVIGAAGLDSSLAPQSDAEEATQSDAVDLSVGAIAPSARESAVKRFLQKAQQGGIGTLVATVIGGEDWPSAEERVQSFTSLLSKFGLAHCRTVEELKAALQNGKTSVVYKTSGAYWFAGPHGGHPMISVFEVTRIQDLHRLGVRVMQVTDDYKGWLGDGCTERTDCGLTDYGLWAIKAMNEIGIVIDCSHASYHTSMETIEASKDPVIFSHSNVAALCASKRNLRDDQIRALAAKGGVIGINALAAFVNPKEPVLASLVEHINYIAQLVGAEHVALGLGYGQEGGSTFRQDDKETYPAKPWKYVLADYSEIPSFREALRARFSEQSINLIFGGNALRIFRAVWKT